MFKGDALTQNNADAVAIFQPGEGKVSRFVGFSDFGRRDDTDGADAVAISYPGEGEGLGFVS